MVLDESFWLAICFIIFLILFTRPFVKILNNYLAQQQESIMVSFNNAENSYNSATAELDKLKNLHKNLDAGIKNITEQALTQTSSLIKLQEEEFAKVLIRRKQQFSHQLTILITKAEKELLEDLKHRLADQLIIHFTENPKAAAIFTKHIL